MDRLLPDTVLRGGSELASGKDWFRLVMHEAGELFIFRVQTRASVWSAIGTPRPGTFLAMQGDGNLVAYDPAGTPLWATGTDGHPGAWALLHDDGSLAVYDRANARLWSSGSGQDMQSPTIRYVDVGFDFNETSESWKELCSTLPCFEGLQWPGYRTVVINDRIDGEDVVIQLWIGWCPKFLGFVGVNSFPGGVGGEVGVYRRMPGRQRPAALPALLPSSLGALVTQAMSTLTDDQLWWPFPELGATLEFSLENPAGSEVFFRAGPEKSYWLAKWMDDASYLRYRSAHPQAPLRPDDWVIRYKVEGRGYASHIPAWDLLLS